MAKTAMTSLAIFSFLVACGPPQRQTVYVAQLDKDGLIPTQLTAPTATQKNIACWAQDTQPAIVQTKTKQVLLEPATFDTDDTLLTQAVYGTETRQDILRERAEAWFQTTCDAYIDQTYIATAQRALTVRGYYTETITGEMNAATLEAIKDYQTKRGLESTTLSLAAAQQLGVAAYGRPPVSEDTVALPEDSTE
ncbi:MAG: peptidoglycan-binding domain-containing protein [Pseudoruegeria sp.]